MHVHHVGAEVAEIADAQMGGDARQRRETVGVVGVVRAGRRVDVRIAGPRIKMRRVEDVELQLGGARPQNPRRAVKQAVVFADSLGRLQFRHDAGIAGRQRAHHDAGAGHRFGQRSGDVRQPAGLHQRINFRRYGENMQIRH